MVEFTEGLVGYRSGAGQSDAEPSSDVVVHTCRKVSLVDHAPIVSCDSTPVVIAIHQAKLFEGRESGVEAGIACPPCEQSQLRDERRSGSGVVPLVPIEPRFEARMPFFSLLPVLGADL